MRDRTNRMAIWLVAVTLVAGLSFLLLDDGRSEVAAGETLQAIVSPAQVQNPCNPCRKKTGQNPCAPGPQKRAQNPCNPCGERGRVSEKVYPHAAHYRSWAKLTEPAVSMGHGGKYVVTYANPAAEAAIRSGRFPFGTGAIFLKEGYEDAGGKPGELTTLYVMEKRGRDWYYAMTDPQGTIQMGGMSKQAAMCSSCHAGAKKTDFVFTAAELRGQPVKTPTNPCAKKKGENPCGKRRP